MIINDHKQSIVNLLKEGADLLQKISDQENRNILLETLAETEKKKEPVIMFYGLYNAGKSTLGNALCNANLKIGPTPTTVSIQKIHWEGYTLIDTPGINAFAEHTEVAEEGIHQSDVILFVVDNADTFDTKPVYEAIVNILKMGKPLAVVINQKNVDTSEDPNIPVPARLSILKVQNKIMENLAKYAADYGIQIENESNFLGFFPVNAKNVLRAREKNGRDEPQVLERNGIHSLRNAMNTTIRHSEQIYMLRTPLITLRDTLKSAMTAYQSTDVYGEKQQLAENRESLLASRQRLRDRLLMDGLRKIESILESVKTSAAAGQPVEGLGKKLSDELNLLLKEAVGQEQEILRTEIKLEAMSAYHPADESAPAPADETSSDDLMDVASVAAAILEVIKVPIPMPVPIPLPLIIEALRLIGRIFGNKKDQSAEDAARRSQEQLAQYYKWLNELRDQEIKIKSDYEKTVNDLLQQYYDPKLAQIDQALAEAGGSCAEHTQNLRALEQLLLRAGDEMVSLPIAG